MDVYPFLPTHFHDEPIKVYEDVDLEIDLLHALKAGYLVFADRRYTYHLADIINGCQCEVFNNTEDLDRSVSEALAHPEENAKKQDLKRKFIKTNPYFNTGNLLKLLIFKHRFLYTGAKMKLKENKISDAAADCKEILNSHPYDPYALCLLGEIFILLSKFDESEYSLRASYDFDHGIIDASYLLRSLYEKKNNQNNKAYFNSKLSNFSFLCNKMEVEYSDQLHIPHVESLLLKPFCVGYGLDIGCGWKKTFDCAVGVDLLPRGKVGKYGSQEGLVSDADICGDGALLPFKDNSVDYLVAKHNFEHYDDPRSVLKEWVRVVKPEGIVGIIVPDDCFGHSKALDPTHKQVFTLDSLISFVEQFDDLSILEAGHAVPYWSIYLVLRKKETATGNIQIHDRC